MTDLIHGISRRWRETTVLRSPLGHGPAGEGKIGLVLYFDHEREFGNPLGKDSGQKGFESVVNILQTRGVRATWNCVGLVGLHYPHTIERLVADGHEIACHGYAHVRPSEVGKKELYQDIAKAKALFKERFQLDLKGFHSPADAWSRTLIDALLEHGFEYDIAYEKPGPNRSVSLLSSWRLGRLRSLTLPLKTASAIVRIPSAGDDWSLISKKRAPKEMREEWRAALGPDQLGKTFALGFHPWVLGMDDSRIDAFRDFMDATCCLDYVRLFRGSEIAEWARGKG